MKKLILSLSVAGLLVVGSNYYAYTSSGQPPAAHTGAPGENNCSTSGCHSGALNTGSGTVSILNLPSQYTPGQTYNLQVQVTDGARTRFGFELTALDASNAKQGNISLVNTSNTAIANSGGRQYLTHRNAGSNNLWNFNWVAPATNVGPITFYIAGNAANGDGGTGGDRIYTTSQTMTAAISTGILDVVLNEKFAVYPNPASGQFSISAENGKEATLYDIQGKFVKSVALIHGKATVNAEDFASGIYYVRIKTGTEILSRKLVIE